MFKPLFVALALSVAATGAVAQALPGQAAPSFSLADVAGKRVDLADFRGKYVVLEWTNPACPFVRKHYGSGNMQALQKRLTAQDVVWLTVNSTATSHVDYMAPAQQAAWISRQGASPTALLVDSDGTVGRRYGAKTTPHMYVIDPTGRLAYAGAIDDKRSADPADVKTARNFVDQALTDLRAGRAPANASTTPYGCSVKYAD